MIIRKAKAGVINVGTARAVKDGGHRCLMYCYSYQDNEFKSWSGLGQVSTILIVSAVRGGRTDQKQTIPCAYTVHPPPRYDNKQISSSLYIS